MRGAFSSVTPLYCWQRFSDLKQTGRSSNRQRMGRKWDASVRKERRCLS